MCCMFRVATVNIFRIANTRISWPWKINKWIISSRRTHYIDGAWFDSQSQSKFFALFCSVFLGIHRQSVDKSEKWPPRFIAPQLNEISFPKSTRFVYIGAILPQYKSCALTRKEKYTTHRMIKPTHSSFRSESKTKNNNDDDDDDELTKGHTNAWRSAIACETYRSVARTVLHIIIMLLPCTKRISESPDA